MQEVTIPLAFAAGVLSFLSPCVLPLIPSYLTFITGLSFEELTDTDPTPEEKRRVRMLTISNSLMFILGFSTVFTALGATSSLLGSLFENYHDWIRIIGGVLVIVFGLFISGLIKLDFLMKEKKFHVTGKPAGFIGTYFVGMAFAAGWTPCVGPILGTILMKASLAGSTAAGVRLLAVYSLGLGLPLFLAALSLNSFLVYSRAVLRHMKAVMLISGLILIAFGVLMLTDNVRWLSGLLPFDFGINF
jgi:cytochrome c-type biogenesis protein